MPGIHNPRHLAYSILLAFILPSSIILSSSAAPTPVINNNNINNNNNLIESKNASATRLLLASIIAGKDLDVEYSKPIVRTLIKDELRNSMTLSNATKLFKMRPPFLIHPYLDEINHPYRNEALSVQVFTVGADVAKNTNLFKLDIPFHLSYVLANPRNIIPNSSSPSTAEYWKGWVKHFHRLLDHVDYLPAAPVHKAIERNDMVQDFVNKFRANKHMDFQKLLQYSRKMGILDVVDIFAGTDYYYAQFMGGALGPYMPEVEKDVFEVMHSDPSYRPDFMWLKLSGTTFGRLNKFWIDPIWPSVMSCIFEDTYLPTYIPNFSARTTDSDLTPYQNRFHIMFTAYISQHRFNATNILPFFLMSTNQNRSISVYMKNIYEPDSNNTSTSAPVQVSVSQDRPSPSTADLDNFHTPKLVQTGDMNPTTYVISINHGVWDLTVVDYEEYRKDENNRHDFIPNIANDRRMIVSGTFLPGEVVTNIELIGDYLFDSSSDGTVINTQRRLGIEDVRLKNVGVFAMDEGDEEGHLFYDNMIMSTALSSSFFACVDRWARQYIPTL